MDKYYMKKFNKFADFIIECLVEEYTKLEFTSYELKKQQLQQQFKYE